MKNFPRLYRTLTLGMISTLVLAVVSQTAQAQNTTVTFWPNSTVPSVPDSGPDNAVEVGLEFSSSQAGTVIGVQFYKSAANTGTHVGNLWSSAGKNLASVTFTGETASGWQQANFATPVAITAGTTYTISYHTTVGHYADTEEFFTTALSVPPLSAPVNAGVYKYGSKSSYPTSVWNASNYWVQPVVSIGPPALSAMSISPTSVAGGNSATGTVTLTGPATSGGIVVTLTSSSTAATVPSSVTVAAGATTATFTVTTSAVTSSTSATITASYNGASANATLSVTSVTSITVTISPTSASLTTGGSQQFTATVTNSTAAVTWTASCGTVTSRGLYTAPTAPGTCTVTATVGSASASATVTVTAQSSSGSSTVLLGDQNVEATAYSIAVGTAAAFQASASATGSVQSLVVYLDPSSTASELVAGVYADASGTPGSLLSQGSNTAPVAGAWNPVIIPAASLTSGSPYWIALLGTSGTAVVARNGSSTCLGATSTSTTLTALPATWSGTTTTSCPLSAFGDSTKVVFFDNFPAGVAPSPYWTVLDRQGDYTNDELECYLPANVTQTSNGLVETAEVQTYTCGDSTHTPYVHNYTSGAVGWATLTYTYGTLEVKAEMAGGTGPWPAIWLLGYNCQNGWNLNAQSNPTTCNWPEPGSDEIDFVEILGGDETSVNQGIHTGSHNDRCSASASAVDTNYHVYDLIWSAGSLTWKIDGTTTCTINESYVPDSAMFLIINVAVGGTGGPTPVNSTFPQSTTVNYVKLHE